MALSHIYHTNHVCQAGLKKLKTDVIISKAKSHNQRDTDKRHGKHIDERRSKLNESIIESKNLWIDIASRITGHQYDEQTITFVNPADMHYADGTKVRYSHTTSSKNNAVFAFETEFRYPGDMVWSRFNNGKVEPVPNDIEIDTEVTKAYYKNKNLQKVMHQILDKMRAKGIIDQRDIDKCIASFKGYNGEGKEGFVIPERVLEFVEKTVDDKSLKNNLISQINDQINKVSLVQGYFLQPANMDEFNEWKAQTLEFVKEKFGEKNILSAQVHMDETTPHIHIIGTPLHENEKGIEKLSMRAFVDGPAGVRQFHTEYAGFMAHLGYKRAQEFSSYDYGDINRNKVFIANAIAETISEDPKVAQEQFATVKAKLAHAQLEVQNLREAGKTVQNYRKGLDAEREKNKELTQEIVTLNKKIKKLEAENRRRTCEKQGMAMHPQQDMIHNVYMQLQEQLVQAGYMYYKEQGIDMDPRDVVIDRDYDGIDDRIQGYTDRNGDGVDDRAE